jgi:hypothetical protein
MSPRILTVALAGALLLAGCAGQRDEPPPAQSTAQRETVIETMATVEKVDQTTREVTLRATDGEVVTVVAGPEVRNLPQLAAGDVVRLSYLESIALRMAEPGEGGPATATVIAGRNAEGEQPGGIVGAAVNMVVTFQSYDPATATATFLTPEGQTESVIVHPAMRAFAAARRSGDRVAVELTNAVAVSIVETST